MDKMIFKVNCLYGVWYQIIAEYEKIMPTLQRRAISLTRRWLHADAGGNINGVMLKRGRNSALWFQNYLENINRWCVMIQQALPQVVACARLEAEVQTGCSRNRLLSRGLSALDRTTLGQHNRGAVLPFIANGWLWDTMRRVLALCALGDGFPVGLESSTCRRAVCERCTLIFIWHPRETRRCRATEVLSLRKARCK
jgi:hypothetical protein